MHKKIGHTSCFTCVNEFVVCRNCGEMGSGVCRGDGEKILYAWGRNAPKLKLPPGKLVDHVIIAIISMTIPC